MRPLTILVWHVHGSWLGTFVAGPHRYLLAVTAGSTRGRKRPSWPASVVEVTPEQARLETIDVVVFQNLYEMDEATDYLGTRTAGRDVAAVYVEHNAPEGRINEMQHPLANRADVTIVHVTHFNALFWDTGAATVRVVEHGVADPGDLYSGELVRSAVVINEAKRRARVTGTDLLPALERAAPIDLFGIGTQFDLPMNELHAAIARRRVYVHPFRWTSLGLALLEAMACGMPVVALATTEVPYAVPRNAGIVSNRLDDIIDGIRWLMGDAAAARSYGRRGREYVLRHYGLERFLRDWDDVFALALDGGPR
ncbi:MAG: glycosyltransferase [Candidatus Eremiobacteraeota bacterium]|nr:glycosyltransferase [Candidatus Eremiobacteraeota bacterium]